MGTLSITMLCLLFLLNGVIIGISADDLVRNQGNWKKYLVIFIGSFVGFPVVIIWYSIEWIRYNIWKDYIWTEISFYWKFYRTTFFDDIVAENPNALWNWNRLFRAHKPGSWVRRRLKRHVTLLNKKYKYDYEADEQSRKYKNEQDDEDWTDE